VRDGEPTGALQGIVGCRDRRVIDVAAGQRLSHEQLGLPRLDWRQEASAEAASLADPSRELRAHEVTAR
jgi:hypothetical protein